LIRIIAAVNRGRDHHAGLILLGNTLVRRENFRSRYITKF